MVVALRWLRLRLFVAVVAAFALCGVDSAVLSSADLAGLSSSPTVSGVSGAQGSAFVSAANQVWVVNSGNGQLGVLNLVAKPNLTWAHTGIVIAVNTSMNLVTGSGALGGDIRFDFAAGYLAMRRQGNAYIQDLGFMSALDYSNLNLNAISQIDSWPSVNIAATVLTVGRVFVAYNSFVQAASPWKYAKVRVTGLGIGGALVVDFTAWSILPRYTTKGTGYNQPTGIVATSNGQTGYITELGTGSLLRVNLMGSTIDRASAAVVVTGLSSPAGIILDEVGNQVFVVERTATGRLLRITLGAVAVSSLGTFSTPAGLAVRSDWKTFYLTQQGASNTLIKFDSSTLIRTTILTGLSTPNFLVWQDDVQQDFLLVAERGGATISGVSLATSPPVKTVITSTPSLPSSVAVVGPGVLVVACNTELMRYGLSASFSASGPLFLGIGHVPASKIDALGYADTSVDPGYFFQVKHSPFGGTLALMVNHEAARLLGAVYYYVQVDGATQAVSWGDYLWSGSTFVFTYATKFGNYFAVRSAAELWYNAHLGYFLDTTALAQGLHTVTVTFTGGAPFYFTLGTGSVKVSVDNTAPLAQIYTIFYYPNPSSAVNKTAVSTCGIVQGSNDGFSFYLRATDPEANLLSWSLSAVWGENKGAGIASDAYSPAHVSATHLWAGIVGEVPLPLNSNTQWHATVVGDPTSRQCAHTFFLGVWDRTINGWSYIHYSEYHKSITLMLN